MRNKERGLSEKRNAESGKRKAESGKRKATRKVYENKDCKF